MPHSPRESSDGPTATRTQSPEHPPLKHIWSSDQPMMARIRQIIAHPSSLKLFKYAGVSVISTIVSQVTLFMTFGVWRVMSEVPANILANAVATVPSYYLNRKWVWGKGGRSHLWREVVPFWVLSFIGLGFSSLAVWLAGNFARNHNYGHATTTILVNAANLMSFAILWIVKFLIYNKLFHIDPVEYEEHHAEKVESGSSDPD
ncbi:MAG TPA: GtrA family protein [Acidimicrobiales bacterium]|nr:GtrA family protein [Acidimicrobiales bacterium]